MISASGKKNKTTTTKNIDVRHSCDDPAFSCESCWLTSSHARCPVKSLRIETSACKATIFGRICQLWHSSWSLNCHYFHFHSQQAPRSGRKLGGGGVALPVKQQMAHRHSSQTKCVSDWCVKPLSHPCVTFNIIYTHPSQWEGNNEVMSKATCVDFKKQGIIYFATVCLESFYNSEIEWICRCWLAEVA